MNEETPVANFADDKLALAVGTVWNDKFKITDKLGEGGMSVVYKAIDLQMDRVVALKLLRDEHNVASRSDRFMSEARVLSSLDHENIVKLLAFGKHDGMFFMALEFAGVSTLETALRNGATLEPSRAVALIRQVCRGLSAAHDQGIIHRDIKPSNIMVTNWQGEEKAKIIDFGIAKIMTPFDMKSTSTTTAAVLGSPLYMSPEQCKDSSRIDARTDLYSLGCVLYQMLCGAPPFEDTHCYAVMSAHLSKPISRIPAKESLPESLCSILIRCLDKDPDKRYPSAIALESALAAVDWDASRLVGIRKEPQLTDSKKKLFTVLICLTVIAGGAALLARSRTNSASDNYLPKTVTKSDLTGSTLKERSSFTGTHRFAPDRVDYYKRWLAKNPTSLSRGEATFYLAQDLGQCGGTPEMLLKHYERAAVLFSQDMPLIEKQCAPFAIAMSYRTWAASLLTLGKSQEAKSILEHASRINGSCTDTKLTTELGYDLAALCLAQRDFAQAEKIGESIAKKGSQNFENEILGTTIQARAIVASGNRARGLQLLKSVNERLITRHDLNQDSELVMNVYMLRALLAIGEFSEARKNMLVVQRRESGDNCENLMPIGTALEILQLWKESKKFYFHLSAKARYWDEDRQWKPVLKLIELNRFAEAKVDLNSAVEQALVNCTPVSPLNKQAVIDSMLRACTALCYQKQKSLANTVVQKAVSIEQSPGTSIMQTGDGTMLKLVEALITTGNYTQASDFAQQFHDYLILNAPKARGLITRSTLLKALALSYEPGQGQQALDVLNKAIKNSRDSSAERARCLIAAILIHYNIAPNSSEWRNLLNQITNGKPGDTLATVSLGYLIEEVVPIDIICGKGVVAGSLYKIAHECNKPIPMELEKLQSNFALKYFASGRYDDAEPIVAEAVTNLRHNPIDVSNESAWLLVAKEIALRKGNLLRAKQLQERLSTIVR